MKTMKKKHLFLALILSLIILGLGFGHYQKSINSTKNIELWINSIQSKNIDEFNKLTDSEKLISSISDGYQVYTSKTQSTGDVEDFFNATKNSFLGFIYKTFEKDFYNIINSYFKDETNFSIFYKDTEILSFLRNIDFEKLSYEKISSNNYTVTFYHKKLEENFTLNIITENDTDVGQDSKFKVKSISNLHLFLNDYFLKKEDKLDSINDNVKENIDKSVLITYFETKTFNYFGNTGFSTKHIIKIKNIGDKKIFSLKYRIWVYDDINDENVERIVYLKNPISPNQEIEDFVQDISPMFNVMMTSRNKTPKAEIIFVDFMQYKLEFKKDLDYE